MATVHSTAKARPGRNRASTAPTKRVPAGAGSKASAKRPKSRGYSLPSGVTDLVENQRQALWVALSLLVSLDATLHQIEDSSGDVLTEEDDDVVLHARSLARPVHIVRLAIDRVYQAHEGLDSLYLGRAARNLTGSF